MLESRGIIILFVDKKISLLEIPRDSVKKKN